MKNVHKRNMFIYKHFSYNKKAVRKLEEFNKKLRLEEERIFPIYKKIKQNVDNLVQEKTIDHFNLKVVISCFSDKYHRELGFELLDNLIIETDCNFMSHQKKEIYFDDDWKDGGVPDSLLNFKHCYSFHHLYDHTCLTYYDLTMIEDVWFEIKVDYQFFVENLRDNERK